MNRTDSKSKFRAEEMDSGTISTSRPKWHLVHLCIHAPNNRMMRYNVEHMNRNNAMPATKTVAASATRSDPVEEGLTENDQHVNRRPTMGPSIKRSRNATP